MSFVHFFSLQLFVSLCSRFKDWVSLYFRFEDFESMKLKCLKKLSLFALFFFDPWPKIIFFCLIVFWLIFGLSIWTLFGCVFVMGILVFLSLCFCFPWIVCVFNLDWFHWRRCSACVLVFLEHVVFVLWACCGWLILKFSGFCLNLNLLGLYFCFEFFNLFKIEILKFESINFKNLNLNLKKKLLITEN